MRLKPLLRLFAAAPLLLVVGLAGAVIAAPAAPDPPPSPTTDETVPGKYIVVFKNGTSESLRPQIQGKAHGQVDKEYRRALRGFAATLSAADVGALNSDPNVDYVAPVRRVHVLGQTVPPGMQRINAGPFTGANLNTNVDIATIDTGIDPNHPDLNVAGGAAFWTPSAGCAAPSTSFADDYGHGTEVAGVIGARDNAQGVVGVAPGARLWSVKALNCQADANDQNVLDSIEWILGRKQEYDNGPGDGDPGINITVVNMSIGEFNTTNPSQDPTCAAISNAVAAGTTYVVAAANSATNASKYSPAHCPAAITVSAMVDTDGLPGHHGPGTYAGADDTFASFSNYGSIVKLAAPGVAITTTTMGGAYTGSSGVSGTSFSSPHVAGAAGLLKAQTPLLTPAQVLSTLLARSAPQNGPCGFTGDQSNEPLLSLHGCVVPEPRTPGGSIAFTGTGAVGVKGDGPCTGFCPQSTGWVPPPAGVGNERAPH